MKYDESEIRKGFWFEVLLWVIALFIGFIFGIGQILYLFLTGIMLIMLQNIKDGRLSKSGIFIIILSLLIITLEIILWYI